ncbi:hypothetical protein LC55x_0326 [Lysobacter capsici]|nr:hypothetical protein LC55x_0326 [Lysobacter capsici]
MGRQGRHDRAREYRPRYVDRPWAVALTACAHCDLRPEEV